MGSSNTNAKRLDLIEEVATANIPTDYGLFKVKAFKRRSDDEEALALVSGDLENEVTTVRVHSACLTGEAFHSHKCDCKMQLDAAMQKIGQEGGVILYLFQEGRGIGVINKIRAYGLQDSGADTLDANTMLGFEGDMRRYDFAAQVLQTLGINKIRLMTNNPLKVDELSKCSIEILERIPVVIDGAPDACLKYLETKRTKMGHYL
jgi:3,4-dihydroxy 2-butanone 4-phosphate synthase/GTP cyclohydrolase II